MKILKMIRGLSYILWNKYNLYKDERSLINSIASFKRGKTIFLFGSPGHSNMGDQAQTYCIQRWVKTNFEEYSILIFTLRNSTDRVINALRESIRTDDLLMCHSGYHLTDLYREKDVYCKIAELFPEFKILIFPQTINFVKGEKEEKIVAEALNRHGKITLCCRDEESYEKAQLLFVNCKLLLYPDIVTSLIGTYHFSNKRDGVLFCMRNDVEAFYQPEQIQTLRDQLSDYKTVMTDTTIPVPFSVIKRKREELLVSIFEDFSKYKLIITDRYHGTIFALIANTPVIVISSTDHKLSSGVKWFPEEFSGYVKFAANLQIAHQLANEILTKDRFNYCLPPYFEEHYYSKLKSKI